MQINKPLKQIQQDIDKPILLVQELHVNGKNVLSRVSPCLKAIASRNKFHHQETKCRNYMISRIAMNIVTNKSDLIYDGRMQCQDAILWQRT